MSSTCSASSSSTQQGGLIPGYKHVDAFGSDEDYEDEVEEFYVTLDLGSVDQTLVPSSSSYRLVGLDTPSPYLQLSGTIMRGRHQTLLGTELIFKDITEDLGITTGNVRYFNKTDRRILFREVDVKPKTAAPAPSKQAKFISVSSDKKSGNSSQSGGGLVSSESHSSGMIPEPNEDITLSGNDIHKSPTTFNAHTEPIQSVADIQDMNMDVDE